MAIVSFSRHFIFVKTRKTAGTSVQHSLLPYCGGRDVVTQRWKDLRTGHRAAVEEFAGLEDIENAYGVRRTDFFTFGFTRNPYAITLSRYFYQIQMGRLAGPPSREHFNRWVAETYFVGEPRFPGGRFLKDRSTFLLFDAQLQPKVDFIGRFEFLADDFAVARMRIGLPEVDLAHVNKSNWTGASYREWLNAESMALVKKGFAFELSYFGYSF